MRERVHEYDTEIVSAALMQAPNDPKFSCR